MFVAVAKQSTLLGLCLTLGLASAQVQAEESSATLSDLTKATLDLRHNLIAAEENLFRLSQNTLTIYINIDNLPAAMLNDITITLDGKTIVQHTFNSDEYRALSGGAMKKIYAAPLDPGQHELVTVVNGAASTEKQNTTTLSLDKKSGHDVLKVTVANPLQKHQPELFFEQQRGEAQ